MFKTKDIKENMFSEIPITHLNDFIFCPASIYFHKLYGGMDNLLFQTESQLNGKQSHEAIDNMHYSTRKDILQATDIYCEKYNLVGKLDIFDIKAKELIERKKKIKTIYDGYVFQLYAQYFSLLEMGYEVERISLYSQDDNKKYAVKLPSEDNEMMRKFEETITLLTTLDLTNFVQTNIEKCKFCIYEPACDRALI